MNTKAFAAVALCGAPFFGPQETIKITEVEATMAFAPHGVSVHGANLDLVRKAQINGVPVPILARSETSLVLVPGPQDPGFGKLELFHAEGSVDSGIEFLPSLQAQHVGDTLRVTLHGGEPSTYWIYYSFELLPTPYVNPSIYYCGMLDMTSRFSGMLARGVTDGNPLTLSFRLPPWVAPMHPLHVQGVFLFPTGPGPDMSFTNMFMMP